MRNRLKGPERPQGRVRAFSAEGVLFVSDEVAVDPNFAETATAIQSPELEALLHQLEDDGFIVPTGIGRLLPWDGLYNLLEHPAYQTSLSVLGLPKIGADGPILESRGSLADPTFEISLAGWHDGTGRRLGPAMLYGAVIQRGGEFALLNRSSWCVVRRIAEFHRRGNDERSDAAHRRAWGLIRQAAIGANARLDDFLYRSVVVTPEKLDIGLRKVESAGTTVVEIIPSFPEAPAKWIDAFDRLRAVPDRYDIPTTEGIVQVVITRPVRTVLEQIKRLPGRRVAGTRAEAFIVNPFAALGEDASAVIDPDEFERAKEEAGLFFERFAAHVERDALGYPLKVGLLIEGARRAGQEESELRLFERDEELERFVNLVDAKLGAGMQFCGWDGYDFELMGDSAREVNVLREALEARRKPRLLVSYADVHDLTRYAERVQHIGVDRPYYSPFIAKRRDKDGWFPDNVVPMISWIPEGESEAVAVPITEEGRAQLQAKIGEARKAKQDTFVLHGFDKPIAVAEAEYILRTFEEALDDVERGAFRPEREANNIRRRNDRPTLVIRANIRSIDYEEARRDVLLALPAGARLPRSLKPDVRLKDHQASGLAWLQHLHDKAPDYCRGAVLADDMGLGKTPQVLMLIARAFEEKPSAPAALVVAPLSLLENWQDEIARFFKASALPVLTAYGDELRTLRVPRASIDAQLEAAGLVKFLRPDWRGDAKIVLTTYETLRDLQFSFAAEKWSIMVCDEAQKIKNPNALVTRAAKKQNVAFKIACTGTPVENTLADLWCLFDFVQPGLLGALNDFGRRYRRPIEAETDQERARVEELRGKIKPQILRRTKEDVARDLPRKTMVPSRVRISDNQRALYSHAIRLFKERNEPTARVPFKNHLGLLHYLRLICTDPRRPGLEVFTPEPLEEYRVRAPKLDWLLRSLEDIQKRQEKAIIFCEFRHIQRVLQHYIGQTFGYVPEIINGETTATSWSPVSRQKRIKAFQSRPGFGVMVLSPLAVGFGVNIQGANHVIHYTRTWNPAKEEQATDRVYRIGQTRDVFVYCPIVDAEDFATFDVKLDELLEAKRALARDMLNGSGEVAPGEFGLEDVAPADGTPFSEQITLNDVLQMRWDYFECVVALMWQKRGYRRVYRTPRTDDGVDVVALSGNRGELVQCKASGVDDSALSWDAVKDVVTGEAAYRLRHPGVEFQKACVTNQHFNGTAVVHARLNNVELYDQEKLAELLAQHPLTMLDVERLVYTDWDARGAA
jgi:hypothetical protein